ncbi:hypothetical protein J6590_001285 [Homalodisca vitripennis]|nr:hypothetical protein J6590_001285 [Homalodisca vitripennis]
MSQSRLFDGRRRCPLSRDCTVREGRRDFRRSRKRDNTTATIYAYFADDDIGA